MNEKYIQILGVFLTGVYTIFIAWLYIAEPKSLEELPAKAQTTIENVTTKTQFYIAYSFYRQGFGRISNDDALFKSGLEQINRVVALDKNFKSDDADLQLKTPVELKNEFEEGLKVTVNDFNPLKVLRERK